MGQFVIACYRPKEGREEHLLEEVRKHVPTLREQGLVTDRPPYLMRSKDRTLVEIFEWASEDAVQAAHQNRVVGEMWKRFEEICEYVSLGQLEESTLPFAPFEPVDL
ncbi:MAG: antibiotic biosynthesis monooxygenase [Acidobacteria bacterium]|nr:antibiotic biosynthesis monooxygenase [Acidobacteriota bacterium]